MPHHHPVNFSWRFMFADDPDYSKPDFDDRDWESVDIPHTMRMLPMQYAPTDDRPSIGWYRKRIDLDHPGAARYALHFGAVATKASIWCDGVPIGTHEGAFTPFEFELPPDAVYKRHVQIAIRCDGSEDPLVPPFGHMVDYLVPGGMYREIALVARSALTVDDLYVTSEPSGDRCDRLVSLRYTLFGDFSLCEDSELHVVVEDPARKQVVSWKESSLTPEGVVRLSLRAVRLWDLDEPVLYRIHATLLVKGERCDEISVRTGFRDIAFTNEGFFLNGRRVKLRGLNRHQLYPHVGYAMVRRQQRADALVLRRDLGLQIVRTSHYPQSPHFLDCCDEIGLLVMTEMPGWQHIGKDQRWRNSALHQLREMIERDRNHPSVILWGVRINESADDDEFYARTNEMARYLDPSRPTGGVRNFARSHLLEDVYTYNDFSHDGVKKALADPKKITTLLSDPYLVTEHTGHMFPCRAEDPEPLRTEHALRHARVLDAMYAHRRISGAIGWCFADYQTTARFGGGDGVCYHGVMDMFRIPKLAAAVYASQQEDVPVLTISSQLKIGSHPAHAIGTLWVFTNCERVELLFRGRPVGTYHVDAERFANLPHPPIPIEDLIGERIDELSGFSPRERRLLRDVLNRAAITGFDLPLMKKIGIALLMRRHELTGSDAIELFERFILWWDAEDPVWEFRGMRGNEVVVRKIVCPSHASHLCVTADADTMHEGETYDVLRLIVSLRSESGELQWLSHAPVHIELSGPARVIGPSDLTLCGGQAGFYIRSTSGHGHVDIFATSPGIEPAHLLVQVD